MKTKQIPVIITLMAGLVTCVLAFLEKCGMETFVIRLCVVEILFFLLGSIVKTVLDKNFPLEKGEENIEEIKEAIDGTEEKMEKEDVGEQKE